MRTTTEREEVRLAIEAMQLYMADDGYGDDEAWVTVREAARRWLRHLDDQALEEQDR